MFQAVLVLLVAFQGRPLFYWGSRPPVAVNPSAQGAREGDAARVAEVHAVSDRGALIMRLTLDRPAQDALYLKDGTPVSGRLQAVVYIDADGDRSSGIDEGPLDLRTGADRRLEVSTLFVGADDERKKPAVIVTAKLDAVSKDGHRRTLWRGDDTLRPQVVSTHAEYVEVKLPADRVDPSTDARLILTERLGSWDGRLSPRSERP